MSSPHSPDEAEHGVDRTHHAGTAEQSAASGQASGRDRWFDLLRAMALSRVIAYHMFSVGWLSLAFPAIGVMYALAGSLMARSVDRSPVRAVASRLRRLLPALWVFAALVLAAMWWHGWPSAPSWPRLLTWLVPVAAPPGSAWGKPATEVLWYIVTYLWLVLLSPVLLWFFRRRPVLAVLAPLIVLVGIQVWPPPLGDAASDVITDVATFAPCWLVGFAHRGGNLRRMPLPLLLACAAVSMAVGTSWGLSHPGEDGVDLNETPLGQAFFSLGVVLLLMRVTPSMGWLSRIRPADRLVTSLNARAVTVYLWHNPAIAVAFVVGDAVSAWRLGNAGYLMVALGLLLPVVLMIGWVEDVAAARTPRLLPWRGSSANP